MTDIEATDGNRTPQRAERQWASFKSTVRNQPAASAGFFLFWVWVWTSLQSSVLRGAAASSTFAACLEWVTPLAGYALTFLYVGITSEHGRRSMRGKAYLSIVGSVLAASTLIVVALYKIAPNPSTPIFIARIVMALIMGSATALLHVKWGRFMSWCGSQATVFFCIFAMATSAPVVATLGSFDTGYAIIGLAVVPLASCLLLARSFASNPRARQQPTKYIRRTPTRFIITSFVQGLSFGVLLPNEFLLDGGRGFVPIQAAGLLIASLVMLAVVLTLEFDFNQLIYQLGFIMMALGYLLVGHAGMTARVGEFVQSVGYHTVDILMWALCAYLVKQRGLNADYVFAWTGTMVAGQVVGLALRFVIPDSISLSSLMVFVLLASALCLYDNRNIRTGWGMANPTEPQESSSFELGCSSYCVEHNLTRRETEIFMLLAQGRNRAYICETLILSRETVKTHVRNIYRKLNIHSQQEVISIAEEQAVLFE